MSKSIMQGENSFTIKIAGIVYDVKSIYKSTYYYCKEYLSDEKPDVSILITEEDIQSEIDRGRVFYYTCEELFGGTNDKRTFGKRINENCIETIVLHQKIIEASLAFNVFFLHSAVVAVNNQAFLFTAPSGTGKTTHIKHWLKNAKDAYVVNGDKPFIKITDTTAFACGTPWCGKENLGTNTMVPLKTIVILERSDENYIENMSFGQAYPYLLPQVYLPDNAEKAKAGLMLLSKLYGKVSFWHFHCNNFKEDCFQVAYNALIK